MWRVCGAAGRGGRIAAGRFGQFLTLGCAPSARLRKQPARLMSQDFGPGRETTLPTGGFLASRWDLWLRPNFDGQIKINAPSSEIPAFERIITHMGVPGLSHEGGLIFAGQRTVAEEFQLG